MLQRAKDLLMQSLNQKIRGQNCCMVKDAIGRRWQLGTIQVDYNLPERFGLEYTGEDNKKHRPVMLLQEQREKKF